jgi:hypothetical protein
MRKMRYDVRGERVMTRKSLKCIREETLSKGQQERECLAEEIIFREAKEFNKGRVHILRV